MTAGNSQLKIAVVTEDGQTISSHFGMAALYRVFTIADGRISGEEQRAKPHHAVHPQHSESHTNETHQHGDMVAPITDCQVLLCGGMGQPAYQKVVAAGLEVILVGGEVRSAVEAYLQGNLHSDPRRVHVH